MLVAAQFYTLRDFTGTLAGLEDALRRVREIGYRAVQLSAVGCLWGQNPDATPGQVRDLLDRLELRCIATHRPWPALLSNPEAEIELHKTLGCDYTAPGAVSGEYGQEASAYEAFLADYASVADQYERHGLRIGYHNHWWEFVRGADGRTGYQTLLHGDPRLQLEIDTYWVALAGADPAHLLRQAAGRIAMVHVKDAEVIVPDGTVMAPVGEGNLHWDAILAACRDGGTEVLIVEQDVCRRDPFDCLRSSFEFLAQRI